MYKVAIPSYKREQILLTKTLPTLLKGKISPNSIYIFVANNDEKRSYECAIPAKMYNKIIVGKKGIANQRIFIKNYFKVGEYIVSIDDDVERVEQKNGETFKKISNLDTFFKKAYKLLKKHKLFLWGVYPVRNAFFMKGKEQTTDLRFVIGVLHGFIVRKGKNIEPSRKSEGKEDYEQTILYYLLDGGVLRFNRVTFKTKFLAPGGLGCIEKRFGINKKAAKYLKKTYPELVTIFHRKNGMTEIRLRDGRNSNTRKKNGVKKNCTKRKKLKK